MTSLFDQYEQDSQQSLVQNSSLSNAMITQEDPIFQRQRVNFTPKSRITHLVVSSNYLVLSMANNYILRFDLQSSKPPQEIDMDRIFNTAGKYPRPTVSGLFLDPTADHLLITFANDLLYQHRKFPKPKPTSKFRGHEITAVGWHPTAGSPGDPTTKSILLGTSHGIIFETEISSDESIFSSTHEVYSKQVFDIGRGTSIAITGLQFHKFSAMSNMYFVIATTVDRLYQFVGSNSSPDEKPLLQQVFNNYLNKPEGFQQIPSKLEYSCLQLYRPGPKLTPTTLAWLTSTGIFYGQIDLTNKDNILTKTTMFAFPTVDEPPLSFLLTEFHILLLYSDHITGISILNEELVFQDNYNEKLVKIIRDPMKGTIWLYTEAAVYRYKVTEEDRNVWRIYLDRGEFEMAEKYCKNNPTKIDRVLVKQAEALFKKKA